MLLSRDLSHGAIKEPGEDKRKIPPGMFKPHMTWMISGKTGSGKSTALIRMLKAYCDSGVFQKVVLISPTAAYDAKYKMLPLSAVHEDYSDELLSDVMEEQKDDMEDYQQTALDIKLYEKFMKHKRLTKAELLRLYTMHVKPLLESCAGKTAVLLRLLVRVRFTAKILRWNMLNGSGSWPMKSRTIFW